MLQFHERVQLDSITHNELGDPDMLAHLPPYAPAAAAGPIGKCEARMSEASACTGCESVRVDRSKNRATHQGSLLPALPPTPPQTLDLSTDLLMKHPAATRVSNWKCYARESRKCHEDSRPHPP